ncbi:MAG: carboxypeptidase-like regulatory domain-containing protein [Planctomycetota bacterium]
MPIDLERGDYVAALHAAELGMGATVSFTVDVEPQTVVLETPYPFDLEFPVLDADTEEPIEGAQVSIERVDVEGAWPGPAVREIASDALGQARFPGLTPGRWRLIGRAEGYAASETVFDYPGSQVEAARETGLVELEAFYLPISRPVNFELVHREHWLDATDFSVALTHTGTPVPFDEAGRATLGLGWYGLPLYIKVDYPGLRSSVRYLDAGLPDPDAVHRIEVGGPRELAVQLEIAPEILEQLAGGSAFLGVSFRAGNGDAVKVGDDVVGPTTAVFYSVQAEHATVSLETTETGEPITWAARRIALEPAGRTTCTLHVDAAPMSLLVTDESGAAVEGFECEIRPVPDDTAWLLGGRSDEQGLVPAARLEGGRGALCGYLAEGEILALDCPVQLDGAEAVVPFELAPLHRTFVEVRTSSAPLANVEVDLLGALSGFPFYFQRTRADGTTAALHLVAASRARARVSLDGYWTPTPELDLLPGRNLVVARTTGVIRVTDDAALVHVRSVEFGATLSDWRETDLLRIDRTNGGALLCHVPVGNYEVEQGDAEDRTIAVTVGATVPAGV